MDADLVLIFSFVLTVVVIVTIGVTKIVNRSLDHQERMKIAHGKNNGTSQDEFRKLEERVRVLERIATDGNNALASQIESLRDLHELDMIESNQEAKR